MPDTFYALRAIADAMRDMLLIFSLMLPCFTIYATRLRAYARLRHAMSATP